MARAAPAVMAAVEAPVESVAREAVANTEPMEAAVGSVGLLDQAAPAEMAETVERSRCS